MIIVYGNCQAGVYADLLLKICPPEIPVRYIKNFVHPTELEAVLDDAAKRATRLILRQTEVREMPQFAAIKDIARTVPVLRFPPLDFNLLWPFNFNDPRNVSEPPNFPFGRFPYGDRVVVELLREGLSGDALGAAYRERSVARMPDFVRLEEIEAKRLAARDADSDFAIGAAIMAQFRAERLFWTINHPTGRLLGRQFGELLSAAFRQLDVKGDAARLAAAHFANYEPFGAHQVPIHPEVARRLGLSWCGEDMKYKYLDGSLMTFEETMRRYIAFS